MAITMKISNVPMEGDPERPEAGMYAVVHPISEPEQFKFPSSMRIDGAIHLDKELIFICTDGLRV